MLKRDRVETTLQGSGSATWEFARKPVKGTEARYRVVDGNFRSRGTWEFVVRTPQDPGGYIEVRPTRVPNRSVWAGLDRRTVQFKRGTKPKYRSKAYARLYVSDVTGERTKKYLTSRAEAPYWLKGFNFRTKKTVVGAKARDADHPVIVVDLDDTPP